MVPQTPMAMPRSCSSSKVMRISAAVAGSIAAAPTARKARAAISTGGEGANAASREAAANRARPVRNIRLWPMRSPSVPAPGSSPAITSGYALMIHSFCEASACRSLVRAGRAV